MITSRSLLVGSTGAKDEQVSALQSLFVALTRLFYFHKSEALLLTNVKVLWPNRDWLHNFRILFSAKHSRNRFCDTVHGPPCAFNASRKSFQPFAVITFQAFWTIYESEVGSLIRSYGATPIVNNTRSRLARGLWLRQSNLINCHRVSWHSLKRCRLAENGHTTSDERPLWSEPSARKETSFMLL